MVAHVEFRARKEPPGEGEDLLDVDCITLDRKMALPINPVHTLQEGNLVVDFHKISDSCSVKIDWSVWHFVA